jgi:hypothetical protein
VSEFIVECYWPHLTESLITGTARHMLDTCSPDYKARPTSCLLVPSDGLVLLLFQAATEADVRQWAETTELPFDRIVKSVQVDITITQMQPTDRQPQ